jgi:hypothetical protein
MKEISFNDFVKATRHKKIKWYWFNRDVEPSKRITKSGISQKFYSNKDYKIKFLIMPFLLMGLNTEFFINDDKSFLIKGEKIDLNLEVLK